MASVVMKEKNDLTQGSLLPKIILYAIPLIATAILQLLFNTADTIVVGRWGGATPEECENALAAVGSCGALTNLIINLFIGLSVGSGVCVAHEIGARRFDEVSKVVHTSVLTSLVSSVFVTAAGLLLARPLLQVMGTPDAVLDQAVPYMCAVFCGVPANMLYNYCAGMLRSAGDTTHPLTFLSIAGAVNVLLNLLMVIVFKAGALGVGVATAASQWVSCLLIVVFMARSDGPCRLEWSKLHFDREKLVKVISIGLPAGIQGTVFSFSNVLIQSSVNSFGKVVIAGNTAASNLDSYIYATQNALYATAVTFVGQNMGAQKYERLKKSILYCMMVVSVVGLSVGGFMYLMGEPLLRIYAPENEAIVRAGMIRLEIFGFTYFMCGLMEVGCGALRGLGNSFTPMITSLIGSCLLRVVWICTIFRAFHTIEVLYLSYPVSWFMTAAAHYVFCYLTLKKKGILHAGDLH